MTSLLALGGGMCSAEHPSSDTCKTTTTSQVAKTGKDKQEIKYVFSQDMQDSPVVKGAEAPLTE